jgi:hypothetical protein
MNVEVNFEINFFVSLDLCESGPLVNKLYDCV